MLTIPITTLMSQGLYQEYLFWLQHHGCDEEHAGKEMAYAFIQEVETGGYDVPSDVKTDAHRLYAENRYCLPKTATTHVNEPAGSPS